MLKSSKTTQSHLTLLDTYTVIDLDRTILKSTALFYQYIIPELSRSCGFSSLEIEQVQAMERAQRGRAFDFIAYLAQLPPEAIQPRVVVPELAKAIVDRQRDAKGLIQYGFVDAILVKGTLQLFEELSSRSNEQWGIMTSGGVLTQTLKSSIVSMIASELIDITFPVQIVSTEHKAQTIADDWYKPGLELYVLPESGVGDRDIAARTLRLLDDKQSNLSLDSNATSATHGSLELYHVQAAERIEAVGLSIIQILATLQHS